MCMRVCVQRAVVESCGCHWPKLDIVDHEFDSGPCNIKQTKQCYQSVRAQFDTQNK